VLLMAYVAWRPWIACFRLQLVIAGYCFPMCACLFGRNSYTYYFCVLALILSRRTSFRYFELVLITGLFRCMCKSLLNTLLNLSSQKSYWHTGRVLKIKWMGTIFVELNEICQTHQGIIHYLFQIHMLACSKYACQIRVKHKP
jgi:hypothetical protein